MSRYRLTRMLVAFLALPLLLLWGPTHAIAQSVQNMPVQGGKGGGPFVADCPRSSHLVGIRITKGAWVNSMTGECLQVKVVPARSLLVDAPVVGSSTGPKSQAGRCGIGQSLQGIKYGFTRDGSEPKFVDYVQLICSQNNGVDDVPGACLDSDNGCWDLHPDHGHNGGQGLSFESRCLAGQVAVGFTGRSGSFVDALAMRCSPDMTPRHPIATNPGGGNSCGSGGNCSGTGTGTGSGSGAPTTNRCCSIPYSDPLTGALGVTHTCGPVCK